jgi:hypothetical protein
MSTIYEVRSVARTDGKTCYWGARNTREEAESLLAERTTGKQLDWARQYHARWWIEEIDTTGMFEFPDLPSPRERFTARTTPVKNAPAWDTLLVEVRNAEGRSIANYPRNHWAMYRTFEPFRQGAKMLALVSGDYTATSVMDLATGKIIASESPSSGGFCPVGFYVPDWWDINDSSILPGSRYWSDDLKEPRGNFGFVWGCVWGDDSSWKVEYLDLSQVQQGKILRDDRFGYVELATHAKLEPKDFIDCSFRDGKCTVTLSVLATFDLASGKRQVNEFE